MKPKCFVLMSFEPDRWEVFEHAIRPAAEAAGFDCYRADYAVAPRAIVRDIIHSIFKDEVIIADISGFNPNVFYELGVAHTVGNKTIIICEETKEKLPFDLKSNRIIFYRKNVDGLKVNLRNHLERSLRDFPNWSSEPSNPVQDFSPVRYTVPLLAQAELEKTTETLRQKVRYLQDEKRRGELRTLILALSHIEIGHLKGLTGPEPFYYEKRPEFLQELRRLRTLGFIRHKSDTKIGDLPETGDLKQYLELTDLSKQVLEEILRIVMQ